MSIPPGKMQAKELLGQSMPPGKFNFQDVKPPTPVPANVARPALKNPTLTRPDATTEKISRTNPANATPIVPVQKEEPANEPKESTEVKDTEPAKAIQAKIPPKNKQQGHVSERIAQERKEAVQEVAIPAGLILLVLLGLIAGVFNVLDALILIGTIAVANYDYHTANASKWASYVLMLMSMFIVYFCLKSFIPSFENTKIAAMIYYLLDFSLLLISFIGAFFVLKGLDFISVHKNKSIRPIGGVIKSTLAFLSIILIVSSTNIIEMPYIKSEFEKSKVANFVGKLLPNVKIGKKINLSIGKYGLRIEK